MGLFSSLFGDSGKSASRSQAAENEKSRELIKENTAQARAEIFDLFPAAEQARLQGSQAALDIFGQTVPESLGVFQRGNVGAQQALTQGLPQIQAALLGQPVDFGQIQPQTLDFSTQFAQQQLPQFTSTVDALAPSRARQVQAAGTDTQARESLSQIIERFNQSQLRQISRDEED